MQVFATQMFLFTVVWKQAVFGCNYAGAVSGQSYIIALVQIGVQLFIVTPGLQKLLQPCSRAARKWRENEKMKRKWRENEEEMERK